ncbi:MAG: metal-dependent transcriptional regulator [Candidatus Hodarchaeota archaeon]
MFDHEVKSELRAIEEEIFEVLFYLCNKKNKNERVKMKEILDLIDDLSKAQLTNIIRRKLEPRDLVDYLPYSGILLTDKGYIVAKWMLRRHRLAEALLGNILGLDWELIHDQACYLEHGISEVIAEAILANLESPPLSPYGFPIPSATSEKEVYNFDDIPLLEAPCDSPLFLKRVKPSTRLLQELKKLGINGLGAKFVKVRCDAKKITLLVNNKEAELNIEKSSSKEIYVGMES